MAAKLNEGKTQDPRLFTVKVCAKNEVVIGTAFAVDRDRGFFITCKHVARTASPDPLGEGARLWLYLPQLPGNTAKLVAARVARLFSDSDEDVVAVQLERPPLPNELEVAILGPADGSIGLGEFHPFLSFGYRREKGYQGWPAKGEVVHFADKPLGKMMHSRPVMLDSKHIDSGMSGAAVLDMKRNLVIGVVAETWDSRRDFADRDTSFAVDAAVLGLPPMDLPLRDTLPLTLGPRPSDIAQDTVAQIPRGAHPLPTKYNNAPPPLGNEWAGRTELLRALTNDWADSDTRATGLIGFGGEGKSSLARKWLDEILSGKHPDCPSPDGVFWWGFYQASSVDAFLEAALAYLAGPDFPKRVASQMWVALIGALLQFGRYIFVLDGLEVWQHQEGDQYGGLRSGDLLRLLNLFTASGHESLCIVTSRVPLIDLMNDTAYQPRDVERLSRADGRQLILNLGAQGDDLALDALTDAWDGHALTLSLLASYLVEWHGADITQLDEIPRPLAEEPRYDRIYRVLRRYDEHLSSVERDFLVLFSAFRGPVEESTFRHVFRGRVGVLRRMFHWKRSRYREADEFRSSLTELDDEAFGELIRRLMRYRILRYDPHIGFYTIHPLIFTHYLSYLTSEDFGPAQSIHEIVKDYYLSLARGKPSEPTLDSLAPLVEAVYHACQAGNYNEAWYIYWERVSQGNLRVLSHFLGAEDTALTLLCNFFPDGDVARDPLVTITQCKPQVLHLVGACLGNVGRPNDALNVLDRCSAILVQQGTYLAASFVLCDLAAQRFFLGDLSAGIGAADRAWALTRLAEKKEFTLALQPGFVKAQFFAMNHRAWGAHLRGDFQAAGVLFQQAEKLYEDFEKSVQAMTAAVLLLTSCEGFSFSGMEIRIAAHELPLLLNELRDSSWDEIVEKIRTRARQIPPAFYKRQLSEALEESLSSKQSKRLFLKRLPMVFEHDLKDWIIDHIEKAFAQQTSDVQVVTEREWLSQAMDFSVKRGTSGRVMYAEHLLKVDRIAEARAFAVELLKAVKSQRQASMLQDSYQKILKYELTSPCTQSECFRVLGDSYAKAGMTDLAIQNYHKALDLARGTSSQPALAKALLARGVLASNQGASERAQIDLNEALEIAVAGSYRIYEADARSGLAGAYLAEMDFNEAKAQAERARWMSAEMGYYWGKRDAEEILARIGNRSVSD